MKEHTFRVTTHLRILKLTWNIPFISSLVSLLKIIITTTTTIIIKQLLLLLLLLSIYSFWLNEIVPLLSNSMLLAYFTMLLTEVQWQWQKMPGTEHSHQGITEKAHLPNHFLLVYTKPRNKSISKHPGSYSSCQRVLQLCWPRQHPVMTDVFSTCTVPHRVGTELLKCGWCDGGTEVLSVFNFN